MKEDTRIKLMAVGTLASFMALYCLGMYVKENLPTIVHNAMVKHRKKDSLTDAYTDIRYGLQEYLHIKYNIDFAPLGKSILKDEKFIFSCVAMFPDDGNVTVAIKALKQIVKEYEAC